MADRKRKTKKEKLTFYELVEALKKDGYIIELEYDEDYQDGTVFAEIKGNKIYAGMALCTEDDDKVYRHLRNRIAADHKGCFDRWSKCPLIMKLPVDYDELLKHLKHLGSKEGYRISSSYEYLTDNPYPYEDDRSING